MPTPKKGYYVAGQRVPSVTTILGRFKDAGGLIQGAFKVGKELAPDDPRGLYDKTLWGGGASVGSAAHAGVEAHVNGQDAEAAVVAYLNENVDGDAGDMKVRAMNAFAQFERWLASSNIELISQYQELQLVHPGLGFGGTPDALGMLDGNIVLLDWKTSNKIYPEHLVQCVAYRALVNFGVRMDTGEPVDPRVIDSPVNEVHICRFAKDFEDFEHRSFTGGFAEVWQYFRWLLRAYQYDKTLKARIA